MTNSSIQLVQGSTDQTLLSPVVRLNRAALFNSVDSFAEVIGEIERQVAALYPHDPDVEPRIEGFEMPKEILELLKRL